MEVLKADWATASEWLNSACLNKTLPVLGVTKKGKDDLSGSLNQKVTVSPLYTNTCYNNKFVIMTISYMPYLTLWDKILQNLACLEGDSHKKNSNLTEFRPFSQQILWRNKHKSHIVVVFTSFMHETKDFRVYLGSSKVKLKKISQNFVKSPLKFSLISQILVHSIWHVCSANVTKPSLKRQQLMRNYARTLHLKFQATYVWIFIRIASLRQF